ncbi:OTU domain-containing protein 6B, partial [Gonapodya sp. JEL0774]
MTPSLPTVPANLEPTLDDLLSRHRRELRDLTALQTGIKRAVPKGDKTKKKEALEQCEQLEKDLEQRQIAERAAWDEREQEQAERGEEKPQGPAGIDAVEVIAEKDENTLADAIASLALGKQPSPAVAQTKKPNRQQKRKEKKSADISALRAQAALEAESMPDLRERELNTIRDVVARQSLELVDVPADGHCLYRAIGGQLGSGESYNDLRRRTAAHLRAHRDDFAPFLTNQNGESMNDADYAAYCDSLEKTAVWGGD